MRRPATEGSNLEREVRPYRRSASPARVSPRAALKRDASAWVCGNSACLGHEAGGVGAEPNGSANLLRAGRRSVGVVGQQHRGCCVFICARAGPGSETWSASHRRTAHLGQRATGMEHHQGAERWRLGRLTRCAVMQADLSNPGADQRAFAALVARQHGRAACGSEQ